MAVAGSWTEGSWLESPVLYHGATNLTCFICFNFSSSSMKNVRYWYETSISVLPPCWRCSSLVSLPPEKAYFCIYVCKINTHTYVMYLFSMSDMASIGYTIYTMSINTDILCWMVNPRVNNLAEYIGSISNLYHIETVNYNLILCKLFWTWCKFAHMRL